MENKKIATNCIKKNKKQKNNNLSAPSNSAIHINAVDEH